MESVATANTMQKYAELSVLANHAQYGLELFSRNRTLEPKAAHYLNDGVYLCRLLMEGLSATDSVTMAQLGSISAAEPVEQKTGNREEIDQQLQAGTSTLTRILESSVSVSDEEIQKALDLFNVIVDSYSERVFREINAIRQRERDR